MKRTNENKNKGFSLVELIVVIAIMIVLVAVLAPVFTKYVEQSRRATDVQNANAIAEAVLVDAADGTISADETKVVSEGVPTSIKSTPTAKGDAVKKDGSFVYKYTKSTNTVNVYISTSASESDAVTTYDLATEKGAEDYKNKE